MQEESYMVLRVIIFLRKRPIREINGEKERDAQQRFFSCWDNKLNHLHNINTHTNGSRDALKVTSAIIPLLLARMVLPLFCGRLKQIFVTSTCSQKVEIHEPRTPVSTPTYTVLRDSYISYYHMFNILISLQPSLILRFVLIYVFVQD